MKKHEDNAGATNQSLSAADLMPVGKEAERILLERAQRYSKLTSEKIKHVEGIPYVKFKLGAKDTYGISFSQVKEVARSVILTKLPWAPDFIPGIINRRGNLLAILDLKRFFSFTDTAYKDDPYIIVVTGSDITIGIFADSIEDSDIYDPSSLEAPLLAVTAIKPEYLLGLHRGVTSIINVDTILANPRFLQIGQSKPMNWNA